MKATIPSESEEQRALVEWLNLHPLLRNLFAKLDNEGKRHTIIKNGRTFNLGLIRAVKQGLRYGLSDLLIYFPTKTYHGLFLEMKRNKIYTPSEKRTRTWIAQENFKETVKSVGYACETCYGWEHGKRVIEEYLKT